MNALKFLPALLAVVVSACGSSSSTTTVPAPTPTPTPPPAAPVLTKPTPLTPLDLAQLDNVRPTLTVNNGTSDQATPAKTYDFQIADNSAFTLDASFNPWYATTVSVTGVAEDPSGKTSFTPAADLQPTTKYYWRARLVQGSTTSDWSDVRALTTKKVGYNKPGALYDPLVHSETIGTIGGSKNITWVPGQGIRINDQFAYVIYTLPQTYSSGEMSAEVTGLAPNGEPGKGRIFSILDRLGVLSSAAKYSINVQYRGAEGVPADCITFKSILGDNANSVEAADRFRNIYHLDPSKVYLFSVFWTPTTVRVVVKEGGATGFVLYDELAKATSGTTNWNPDVMYAYVGTSNANYTGVDGSRVGMVFRNFWVGSTPRPTSLGSAIDALR